MPLNVQAGCFFPFALLQYAPNNPADPLALGNLPHFYWVYALAWCICGSQLGVVPFDITLSPLGVCLAVTVSSRVGVDLDTASTLEHPVWTTAPRRAQAAGYVLPTAAVLP